MDEIYKILRSEGYRLTGPRQAIIQTIVEAERWQSIEEILNHSRRQCPSVGLVTVYRTLSLLSELGVVRRIHLEHGCHGYVRADLAHGHHVLCSNCHQAIEFPALDEFPSIIEQISMKTGYVIQGHMLELIGLCPNCQE